MGSNYVRCWYLLSADFILGCVILALLKKMAAHQMPFSIRERPPVPTPEVVPRHEWDAAPPVGNMDPLTLPITVLSLTGENHFGPCFTGPECKARVKEMQTFFMEKNGMPDIPFNFLVGNDGRVYEGRGWNARPQKVNEDAPGITFTDSTLDFALIGGPSGTIKLEDMVLPRLDTVRAFMVDQTNKGNVVEQHEAIGYHTMNEEEKIKAKDNFVNDKNEYVVYQIPDSENDELDLVTSKSKKYKERLKMKLKTMSKEPGENTFAFGRMD